MVREYYLPALQRLGWLSDSLIVEPLKCSTEAIIRERGSVSICQSDYQSLFERPLLITQFDGVVIALPNEFHEDAVTRALHAGLPVLCEKPLALTANACLRLASIAQNTELPLSVGMVRRRVPTMSALRHALDEGLIGDLLGIELEHGGRFSWPSDSGTYFRGENGGLLLNMGVHYLDLAEYLAGPLTPREYKDDSEGGPEANFEFRLSTPDNVAIRVACSYTHSLRNGITLSGTRGKITARVDEMQSLEWQSSQTPLTGTLRGERTKRRDSTIDLVSCFVQQLDQFSRVVARQEEPEVNALQAATTALLIDWAYGHRKPLRQGVGGTRSRPTLRPEPVVITGGTGFVGTKLVERLHELGFGKIRIPVRSHRSGAAVSRFPVERVLTNLLDYAEVRDVIRGARYVFHLAYGTGEKASQVTVDGTKHVVEAAIQAGVETVVIVSTTTVFGHTRTIGRIDETSEYRPDLGEYGRSKAKMEQYCLRRASSSRGTRIVVLNPSSVYGPGGTLFTELPARASKDGFFCWIESGKGKFNYTFVENLVDALVLAAQCPEAHGKRFIISDGTVTVREFLSPLLGSGASSLPSYTRAQLYEMEKRVQPGWRDLFRALASNDVMQIVNRIPALSVPKRLVRQRLGGLYHRAQEFRSRELQGDGVETAEAPPIPPPWLAEVFGPMEIECSSERARKILGWSPIVDLHEGQQACIAWLQQIGVLEEDLSANLRANRELRADSRAQPK